MRQHHEFVIVYDQDGGPKYFRRVLVSSDASSEQANWFTTTNREEAYLFAHRDAAAMVLQGSGLHKKGWRILRSDQI